MSCRGWAVPAAGCIPAVFQLPAEEKPWPGEGSLTGGGERVPGAVLKE